ncbi:MAG: hypothetical protein C4547_05770 [Phycisphaerales bacterium]|nr:MAG: hypothetical protein C4547_05770 [Phycisphaerales bacterium]
MLESKRRRFMTMSKPVPDVLALVICDQIISDRLTGKQSLIGLFSTIQSLRFPAVHSQLCVYCSLTDGHGSCPLQIRLVDSNEARDPLVQGQGTVHFADPRAIANLSLQFRGLSFPEPGEYRVQLFCRGELLREARLMLVPTEKPSAVGDGPDQPFDTDGNDQEYGGNENGNEGEQGGLRPG